MMKELTLKTDRREQMKDITPIVQSVVEESGIENGIVIVYNPHTTGAITINEGADPSVCEDILQTLAGQYPHSGRYAHAEGNSDAHIKSALMGSDRTVPVKSGRLGLGTWQKIFFCEFDGPRTRKIIVTILQA